MNERRGVGEVVRLGLGLGVKGEPLNSIAPGFDPSLARSRNSSVGTTLLKQKGDGKGWKDERKERSRGSCSLPGSFLRVNQRYI